MLLVESRFNIQLIGGKMAYSKTNVDGSVDLLYYKYRNFSICNFGNFSVTAGINMNPHSPIAPKVVQDAFEAYWLNCDIITFGELVDVCIEEKDSRKKVPQSYLQ